MARQADAIIIGAGVIGAATAFELGKRGYKTLNVDKLPSAGYGPTSNPDLMTYVGMPDGPPYMGVIGVQFNCGDTIELRWSNCATGGGEGTWTSTVIPAAGNPQPTEAFGPPAE